MPNNYLLEFYRLMVLIRRFEEKVEFGFSRDQIHGTTHLCIGQEAVPVGICANITDTDYVVGTHRGHGHALAKGLDPFRLFAEIMGKAKGYCGGRGGTQHVACFEKGFLGTNGITGGGIPIATGAALALKYKKKPDITVCFLGDGAVNQGTFHESLNMAAIWMLPILYVCENNGYAMSAPAREMISGESIAFRANAYGIEGIKANGMDVEEVYGLSKRAIVKIRCGGGPVLIECETYRYRGHSKNDPRKYRSRKEEDEWKEKCPVKRLKMMILEKKIADEAVLNEIENNVAREIDCAYDCAVKS